MISFYFYVFVLLSSICSFPGVFTGGVCGWGLYTITFPMYVALLYVTVYLSLPGCEFFIWDISNLILPKNFLY